MKLLPPEEHLKNYQKNLGGELETHGKSTLLAEHSNTDWIEANDDTVPRKIKNWLDLPPSYDGTNTTLLFIFLNCLISLMSWSSHFFYELFILNMKSFHNLEFFRFLTAQFLHADFKHLLSNLLMGSIFVFLLSTYFGPLRIILITVLTGTAINFLSYFSLISDPYHWFKISTDPEVIAASLLGFSGAAYFLGSLWMTLYCLTMNRLSLLHRALKFIGVNLIIFFPSEAFDPNTSYRTHLIGFLFGIIIGFAIFNLNKKSWSIQVPKDLQEPQIFAKF